MHVLNTAYCSCELKLHRKDDDKSQTEGPSDSKELQYSLEERDLRIAVPESRLRMKEAELIAALNPEKKRCSNAAVQANYLSVTECKKIQYIYCTTEQFSCVLILYL